MRLLGEAKRCRAELERLRVAVEGMEMQSSSEEPDSEVSELRRQLLQAYNQLRAAEERAYETQHELKWWDGCMHAPLWQPPMGLVSFAVSFSIKRQINQRLVLKSHKTEEHRGWRRARPMDRSEIGVLKREVTMTGKLTCAGRTTYTHSQL